MLFTIKNFFIGSVVAAVCFFCAASPVAAIVVALLPTSSLSSGTAIINLTAPTGTVCDIAIGSAVGMPDYAWLSQVPCASVTVGNIPAAASKVYVRVFTGNTAPAQDFVVFAASNPTSSIPVLSPTTVPKAPTIISPLSGQKVVGSVTKISWSNVNADSYTVLLGSAVGKNNYGLYTVTSTSVLAINLPQNNKKVYYKIIAQWPKKNLSISNNFISVSAPLPTVVSAPTSTPASTPIQTPNIASQTHISAIWAEEGGDKVAQEELRASTGKIVANTVWNGSTVSLFGARNEVVNFNLVLEAATAAATSVHVSFDSLIGPNNFVIQGKPAASTDLFNWVGRNIELFYVRYLEIKGLSAFTAGNYDESQWPLRWQAANRLWVSRPDHNKNYPDIAVPLEVQDNFTIAAGKNQSIWADVYIPANAPAGVYTGSISVTESGVLVKTIPVQLTVRTFSLPDVPSAKTMLYLGYGDVNNRYIGNKWPYSAAELAVVKKIRDEHFMLAHRHKISLIDADEGGTTWSSDAPRPDWVPRLNGSLFTPANGYAGPGVGVGNGVYAIGSYGSWGWKGQDKNAMWSHTNGWVQWFNTNAPATQYFLYLVDESSDYVTMNTWANWINTNPGVGSALPSFATIALPTAKINVPELDIAASTMTVGATAAWQNAADYYLATAGKKFMLYNGGRPGSGSFMTEDDGTALRELAWGQYKKGVDRWFYWESAYYNNYQAGTGETNLFTQAQTFGANTGADSMRGLTGWNYANGDGVLFYPGTDKVYPGSSYNVLGPFASLRLKFWRRGVQDVDYITLAAKINPTKTQQIVNAIVPKVLWENGVDNPADPTYRNGPVSWSSDPGVWESARAQLADIIEGK